MHSNGKNGAAANEVMAELALSARDLGALLELSDALYASDDDQAAIVKRLCGGIAPLHPGSLIFIAEEAGGDMLSVSHAEGMGAAVIRDVRLEWPEAIWSAPFAATEAPSGFWRCPRGRRHRRQAGRG